MMEIRLARIEAGSVRPFGRHRQMDVGMIGVGMERQHIGMVPLEQDSRECLRRIMERLGVGRSPGHRQHQRHRRRPFPAMFVHGLVEHRPVLSDRLEPIRLGDNLALARSDGELPVARHIAEMLGDMMSAILLAGDLHHHLGRLAHDPLELGARLGLAHRHRPGGPAPASARFDPNIGAAQGPLAACRRPPGLHQAGKRENPLLLTHRPCPSSEDRP